MKNRTLFCLQYFELIPHIYYTNTHKNWSSQLIIIWWRIRVNNFLARLRFRYLEHQASTPHLQKSRVTLGVFASDKMEYSTGSCYGDVRPYRQPCFQLFHQHRRHNFQPFHQYRRPSFQPFHQYRRPSFQPFHQQPPVSVPARFPVRSVPSNYDQTFDKDVIKHSRKSKSNATKARDK